MQKTGYLFINAPLKSTGRGDEAERMALVSEGDRIVDGVQCWNGPGPGTP